MIIEIAVYTVYEVIYFISEKVSLKVFLNIESISHKPDQANQINFVLTFYWLR